MQHFVTLLTGWMEDVEVPLSVFSSFFTRLGFLDGTDFVVPLQMGPFFNLSLMSIGYFGCSRSFFFDVMVMRCYHHTKNRVIKGETSFFARNNSI